MNNMASNIDSEQRTAMLSVFVSSAAVVLLGVTSWLIFDMESTRVINIVFSVAVGAAAVSGFLLATRRHLHGARQVSGCLVAIAAIAAFTYMLPR